ncbi:hypothetical protein C8Q80DRAFT_1272527 [Daedaleopsis nitida]|nr:hypothetical protein C8Q80DRAFT_1272527 [Daedaleopsis nitida]
MSLAAKPASLSLSYDVLVEIFEQLGNIEEEPRLKERQAQRKTFNGAVQSVRAWKAFYLPATRVAWRTCYRLLTSFHPSRVRNERDLEDEDIPEEDLNRSQALRLGRLLNLTREAWESAFRTLFWHSGSPSAPSLSLSSADLRIAAVSPGVATLTHLRTFNILSNTRAKVDFGTLRMASVWNVSSCVAVSAPQHCHNTRVYSIFVSPLLVTLDILRFPARLSSSFHVACETWARQFPALQTLHRRWDAPENLQLALGQTPHPRATVSEAIKPLLSIRSLSDLSLQYVDQFTISNKDLVNIATAWPRLSKLNLQNLPGCPGAPSIMALATHCPSLTFLCLLQLASNGPSLADTSDLNP